MEENYIVAIEIGSAKIKGALALIEPSGMLNILAVHEEPLIDSVRYGQIKNVEETASRIERIRRRLEANHSVTPNKITGCYVGLSGLSLGSISASATIDFDIETEVTNETLELLKTQAINSIFTENTIYQVTTREILVDKRATSNPVGTYARTVTGKFVAVCGAPGLMSNINRVFNERLHLTVNGTIVSATALAATVLTPDERNLGCMLVDFGAETTTVAIYKKGVLQYLSTLPMGSRNITRDLMALTYIEERAEEIKRTLGVAIQGDDTPHITTDGIEQPEINNYIAARTGEIIANILAQIEWAGLKPSDLPAGIITTGGGARMKGFGELLAQESRMKVHAALTPRTIRITDSSILADDSLDVISLANTARQLPNFVSCVEPSQQPFNPQHNDRPYDRDQRDEYDDRRDRRDDRYDRDRYDDRRDRYRDNEPLIRIGHTDNDDILEDDPDDFNGRRDYNNRKSRSAERENQRREEQRRQEERRPQRPSIFRRVADRLTGLVSDDDHNDRFDDE
ncbi:MAG: rod shape-determining protein [Muribaculaceae bacterium]|nr:rod shape-determining protein [Muribaculaceae bacterium]